MPEPVIPSLCPRCGNDSTPVGPNPRPLFCPNCGYPLMKATSRNNGWPSPEPVRTSDTSDVRWLGRLFILALIVVIGLFLLNNTNEGLVIKCHVLGDMGACLLSS
jgi:ribosomal protein L37E